jgi:hypothetical protein
VGGLGAGVEPELAAGGAGSAEPALADGGAAGVGVPLLAGVPLPELPFEPPPLALPELALPELAVPEPPAQVHDCSSSHVKPTPQSVSAWQGTR